MKKLLIILVLLSTSLSFSQAKDSLVDVFGQKREILKLRATPKQVKKIKREYKGDTLYIQRKINGKWWECKHVRKREKLLFV